MKKLLWFFLFLIPILIQHNLIINEPILNFDDKLLIDPVFKVDSIPSYFKLLQSKEILDFQPLRDFSYWINISILKIFKVKTFHLLNVLIFLLSLWQLSKLLKCLKFSELEFWLILYGVACHPIFHMSTAWLSARKHLLAYFFILITIRYFLENKKFIKTSSMFLLSLLSQPIHLMLPLALFCWQWLKGQKQILKNYIVLTTMSVVFFCINIFIYKRKVGVVYDYYVRNRVFDSFWTLGRSVIQALFPYSVPARYFEGSSLNIIGFYLVIFAVLFCWKRWGFKRMLLSFSILYYSLLPVLSFFIYNPYLLMVTTILIIYFVRVVPQKFKIVLGLYLLSFSLFTNYHQLPMWYNDIDLWRITYEIDPGPHSALLYAQEIVMKNPEKAYELLENVSSDYNWKNPAFPTVLGKAIYFSKSFSFEHKMDLFKRYDLEDPWFQYYKAFTFISEHQYEEGTKLLHGLLEKSENFSDQRKTVINEYQTICQKVKKLKCETIPNP